MLFGKVLNPNWIVPRARGEKNMKFDRAVTVALKVTLADFALLLLACILVPPLIRKGIPTAVIGGIVGFVFALLGLAVTVYFIRRSRENL